MTAVLEVVFENGQSHLVITPECGDGRSSVVIPITQSEVDAIEELEWDSE